MLNAQESFRRADDAAARASRRYNATLAQAHARPGLNLEAAYLAELAAEVRRARALKRMMTE